MMTEAVLANVPLPWLFVASLALAAWSASFLLLEEGANLAWRLYRGQRLTRRTTPVDPKEALSRSQELVSWAPVLAVLPAAAFLGWRSPFLAACFIAIGFLLKRYVAWRRSRTRLVRVSEELEGMITVLYSAYLVRPVVASALEEAAQSVHGPLRAAIDRALQEIWVGNNPKDTYASLGKAVANPYLAQLGLILERAEEGSPALVGEALKDLATRLRRRKRLQARVQSSLSMLSWTVRFLQGANALAMVVVLAMPTLRDFYLDGLQRQGLFALVLAAVVGASLYFDYQLSSLKERAL